MRVGVAGGVTLYVRRWEGGDGLPFVLVHGLASNCRTWEGVAERLHELGHPVATVDQRGHGLSDKPDDGYDFATLCADLVAVLDSLGFERPVLAGQSTGGNIVVDLAARAPGRIAGVVGVDGGALELSRRWPAWEGCAEALAPPRLAGAPFAVLDARMRAGHPSWSDWGIEVSMANFEHLPDGTIRPWLSFDHHMRILRSLWEHKPSEVIPALAAPVLLVMADSGDGWAAQKREMAAELLASAPGARVEWMTGDHDLHVQFPVELADLMDASF